MILVGGLGNITPKSIAKAQGLDWKKVKEWRAKQIFLRKSGLLPEQNNFPKLPPAENSDGSSIAVSVGPKPIGAVLRDVFRRFTGNFIPGAGTTPGTKELSQS